VYDLKKLFEFPTMQKKLIPLQALKTKLRKIDKIDIERDIDGREILKID